LFRRSLTVEQENKIRKENSAGQTGNVQGGTRNLGGQANMLIAQDDVIVEEPEGNGEDSLSISIESKNIDNQPAKRNAFALGSTERNLLYSPSPSKQ